MFDLKVLKSAVDQLEEEKGVSKEAVYDAIETSLAAAYKKEYGRRGQIIRAHFDLDSGKTEFSQVKIVVDEESVRMEEIEGDDVLDPETVEKAQQPKFSHPHGRQEEDGREGDEDPRPRYNPEHHIFLEDAKKIKKDAKLDDEIVFELEAYDNFGRIAAQTAKQVIIQKIREAERSSILREFGEREGEIVSGTVERVDRGAVFVDLGKATGIIGYEDQIPRERYRQGERIRAYLCAVEESPRGVNLRLSRSKPEFVKALFALEVPEINSQTVAIKAIAREAGSRSKIAVHSEDDHIDPIGACVGQRGVRVTTVMSELGGEKIDIIEWSENPEEFIADALSPAKTESVEINTEEKLATVIVDREQLSLAIGRNGQNARLAAKLSGWRIDVQTRDGETGETQNENEKKEADSEQKKNVEENESLKVDKEEPAATEEKASDTEKATETKTQETSPSEQKENEVGVAQEETEKPSTKEK